jgi:hypothetical protein
MVERQMVKLLAGVMLLLALAACSTPIKARDPSGAGPASVTDHTVEGGLAPQ